MKEIRKRKIKKKEEFTSHKKSSLTDPSLPYHIPMKP
jgi:hypothetical protein